MGVSLKSQINPTIDSVDFSDLLVYPSGPIDSKIDSKFDSKVDEIGPRISFKSDSLVWGL